MSLYIVRKDPPRQQYYKAYGSWDQLEGLIYSKYYISYQGQKYNSTFMLQTSYVEFQEFMFVFLILGYSQLKMDT